MRLVERLSRTFRRGETVFLEHGHQWESTGVVLLLSRNQGVERCARCRTYRIRGQVEWESSLDGSEKADLCPGRPLHRWET